jgi:S1-C subfamily serine protease
LICLGLSAAFGTSASAQNTDSAAVIAVPDYVLNSVVQILLTTDGEDRIVGSGILVRSYGLIVVPYHLIKNASAMSVRLRNGETFDRAQIVVTDERRNVAVVSIPGANLTAVAQTVAEESFVGAQVAVVASTFTGGVRPAGVLSSVALADEIPGAGTGYRVLKFTALPAGSQGGGLLIDDRGRPLGLLAASAQSQNPNYAVPLSSLMGLVRSVGVAQTPWTGGNAVTSGQNQPVSIPQSSVSVPQLAVLPLFQLQHGARLVDRGLLHGDLRAAGFGACVELLLRNFPPHVQLLLI